MTKNLERQPMFRRTVDTLKLIEKLRKVSPGEPIMYEELSEAIGSDVRKRRGALTSARRYLMREDRIHFVTIRSVGLRRANSAETVESLQSDVKHIGRTARRGLRKSTCVDDEELTEAQRIKWLGTQSLLMVQEAMARPKALKQIEGRVVQAQKVLPYGHVLEALERM